YLGSARAMALSTPTLAWFCAATWPVITPPLTAQANCALDVEVLRLPFDLGWRCSEVFLCSTTASS
ncbi:hypothetical protein, partial [Roseivivax halotolerans]|uniref:hypothetical protein n=1 Tax=Roseivivax halotolerans TaxID=93684 RepID=UPI001C314833